jgi:23S rRNA (guanosine2251-2'-O)-methyltransferase
MIAILHHIRSMHNVGSIFRTADAVGIEKLYLCGITPAPKDRFGNWRSQIAKVALGAERYVPWEYSASTVRLLKKLKKQGYQIFALEQHRNSTPYYRQKLSKGNRKKIALVVGNEVKGLSARVLKMADKILEIPMHGKKESLNVAVAFGIVAFHFAR